MGKLPQCQRTSRYCLQSIFSATAVENTGYIFKNWHYAVLQIHWKIDYFGPTDIYANNGCTDKPHVFSDVANLVKNRNKTFNIQNTNSRYRYINSLF